MTQPRSRLPAERAPMRVVDAHHHIWRQADLPWLNGPIQPRIFGDYAAIRRDYLIDEYIADARPCGITDSIYVQANWPPERARDEAQWVQSVAGAHGWPHAIVAYADFARADIERQLDALAALPLVRGIRQQLHWHTNPAYRFAPRPDLMADPGWRRGFARLGPRGWVFELQVFAEQMLDSVRLLRDFPDQVFVLDHAGMLEDRSEAGIERWRRGMRALARCDNLFVKLSGLGTFVHAASAALMRPIVAETISLFGAERCIYGSNFPIEKLWSDYASLYAAFSSCIEELSDAERGAILGGTAIRVYRLGER